MDIHIKKELIDKICNLEYQIDCQKIKMIDPNNKKKTLLQGFGWIKFNKNRMLHFKMYIIDTGVSASDLIKSQDDKFRDKDGLFNFIAYGVNGKKWNYKIFSYNMEIHFGSISSINSTLYSMSSSDTIDSYDSSCIEFILSPEISIPYNKFETLKQYNSEKELISLKKELNLNINYDDLMIYGKKTDEYNFIGFYSNKFHDNSYLRLIEGLQLITGYRIRPYLVYKQIKKRSSLIINSREYDNTNTLFPPLKVHEFPYKYSNYSWEIFLKYFNSVSGIKKKRFTPIGSIINSIVGSTGAFFEIEILVLCVRIEGMLNILFPNMGNPRAKMKRKIDTLIKNISKWTDDNFPKDRAITAIGNMKSARAKDKLIELKKRGVINKKQCDSWDKLRNASAHSVTGNRGENWYKEYREMYNQVLEMYYRILLYYIGYKGIYTEYSIDLKRNLISKNVDFELYDNQSI